MSQTTSTRTVTQEGRAIYLHDGRVYVDPLGQTHHPTLSAEQIVPICHRHGVTGQPRDTRGQPYVKVPGWPAGHVGCISLHALGSGNCPEWGSIYCPDEATAVALAADLATEWGAAWETRK